MPKHSSKEDASKGQSLNSLPKRLTRLRRCSRKTSRPPVAEANPSHGSPDNTDPEKPVRVPRKEAEPNPTSSEMGNRSASSGQTPILVLTYNYKMETFNRKIKELWRDDVDKDALLKRLFPKSPLIIAVPRNYLETLGRV